MAAFLFASAASAQVLSITPLTWNVIGLDSNNVTAGPDTFPVGVRICNVGGLGGPTASNVTATFAWGAGSTAINLIGSSTINYGGVLSGAIPPSQYTIQSVPANCGDYYFNVQVTRAAASYNQTRQFVITASSTNAASVSTPTSREIFVEKLVSQNRNSITQISGPTSVFVGDTATFVFVTKTAPGGYDQLENFINWPNTVFRVLKAATTYTSPAGGVNSTVYADACGWDAVSTSVTYRSCIGPANYVGGAGGDITTTYVLQILEVGTSAVSGMVHDFSGSSYHYNSDYGAITLTVTSKKRNLDVNVTKTNGTNTVYFDTTTTYSIVVGNSGPDSAVTTTVADPAVTGLTKQSISCSASAGATCPNTVTIAAIESGTMAIPAIAVSSSVTFSVVALVTAGGGTGLSASTVSNTVTVVPSSLYMIDSNAANNTGVDTDSAKRTAHISLTKDDGKTTVVAGSVTTYTLTVFNSGPGDASGSVLQDPAVTGLSCTSLTCATGSGAAMCPAGPTVASISGAGISLPTLPASSSLIFSLACGVTATGMP